MSNSSLIEMLISWWLFQSYCQYFDNTGIYEAIRTFRYHLCTNGDLFCIIVPKAPLTEWLTFCSRYGSCAASLTWTRCLCSLWQLSRDASSGRDINRSKTMAHSENHAWKWWVAWWWWWCMWCTQSAAHTKQWICSLPMAVRGKSMSGLWMALKKW